MVVVAIIGILAAIALPEYNRYLERGRVLGAFPWPPPVASSSVEIPRSAVLRDTRSRVTLSEVNDRLAATLYRAGYVERAYFRAPLGFVLVTDIERIEENGQPIPGDGRFLEVRYPGFSLSRYMESLTRASPGFFRVIAIVVTPSAFNKSSAEPTKQEAAAWAKSGFNKLPPDVASLEFRNDYSITALIYEFRKARGDSDGRLILDVPPAHVQLSRSGIFQFN